jgi:hypothetical protein
VAANERLTVVPTTSGTDVPEKFSGEAHRDAHVRHEQNQIYVDVFDARIKDARKAYLASDSFPWNVEGAADATDFLLGYGFEGVRIEMPAHLRNKHETTLRTDPDNGFQGLTGFGPETPRDTRPIRYHVHFHSPKDPDNDIYRDAHTKEEADQMAAAGKRNGYQVWIEPREGR